METLTLVRLLFTAQLRRLVVSKRALSVPAARPRAGDGGL
jgi:hypothetical protein